MQQNMMGQNIIITEPSKNLRALGRNALAGKWKLGIMAVLVYTLCLQLPVAILDGIFGTGGGLAFNANFYVTTGPEAYDYASNAMPETSFLSSVYTLLVSGALELGITLFFLALFRKQMVGVTDIFLGFEKFGKAMGLLLFQGLFFFLWALLFIIPGIIAAFRYSQAFYILADHPEKGIRQCMDESKMMMKGNKGKYFALNISFIGWMILAAVPVGILEGISELLNMSGIAYAIMAVIQSLFMIPVTVYMYATLTGFYEILAGHLIKETAPAPVMPDAITAAAAAVPVAVPDSAPSTFTEPPTSPASQTEQALPTEVPSQDVKQEEKKDEDFFIPKEL